MDELSRRARALSATIEPFAGQVYFSPECHANYAGLGFSPSQGDAAGVALPDGPAYFTSRGSVMGQVPGEVVACAFGVFNPAAVVPAVDFGWSLTDAATICRARDEGAIGQLTRILGEKPDGIDRANEILGRAADTLRPEGRPLFAGLQSLELPGSPVGDAWRNADRLREYRGDSHINAWTNAGVDATEICLFSEAYWGLALRSYSRTRAWSDAEFDAAEERLAARGWLKDGQLTDAGHDAREAIEVDTDAHMRGAMAAIGDDLDELLGIIGPWSAAIRDAKGYLGGGASDLANASR
jgi:hypothetical protein